MAADDIWNRIHAAMLLFDTLCEGLIRKGEYGKVVDNAAKLVRNIRNTEGIRNMGLQEELDDLMRLLYEMPPGKDAAETARRNVRLLLKTLAGALSEKTASQAAQA